MASSSDVAADEADEGSEEREVALEIVGDLLEKMQVEAKVGVHLTDRDELSGQRRLVIDIRGDDLGVLIGPRGETLYAFQFVARLMAGHVLRHRPYFIIDVEGYRERREKALARLADRMAGKVVKSGRATTLEPMPANERRVIHMTLRENREVFTESTGEGNRRRVRIIPEGSR
jgi:spoIIIJ-associated protein